MGNQQERLPFEVAYLFGVIDGEGSYQLHPDVNKQGRRYWSPTMNISNTDPKIIELCVRGLKIMDVAYFIWTPKISGKSKLPLIRLVVKGIKRMKKFCDYACKIEHAKLERLMLLKEFVDLRLSIPQKLLHSGHCVTYTQKECDIKNKLGELNKEYNTRGRILRDYTLNSLKER